MIMSIIFYESNIRSANIAQTFSDAHTQINIVKKSNHRHLTKCDSCWVTSEKVNFNHDGVVEGQISQNQSSMSIKFMPSVQKAYNINQCAK